MSVLFLSGAGGALGSAIRALFLEKGWSVVGFNHADDGYTNSDYLGLVINATDECSVMTAFESAAMAVGKPDLVISTVGGIRAFKSIRETPIEDVRSLMELNYVSAFLAIKCGSELMAEMGGAIVLIGAETGLKPGPDRGAYSASKAAVVHLTQVAAEEGKSLGISVNCIAPHTLRTPANEEWGTPEEIAKWTDPQSIAEACLFLCSDAGRQVNGAIIRMPNKM